MKKKKTVKAKTAKGKKMAKIAKKEVWRQMKAGLVDLAPENNPASISLANNSMEDRNSLGFKAMQFLGLKI